MIGAIAIVCLVVVCVIVGFVLGARWGSRAAYNRSIAMLEEAFPFLEGRQKEPRRARLAFTKGPSMKDTTQRAWDLIRRVFHAGYDGGESVIRFKDRVQRLDREAETNEAAALAIKTIMDFAGMIVASLPEDRRELMIARLLD